MHGVTNFPISDGIFYWVYFFYRILIIFEGIIYENIMLYIILSRTYPYTHPLSQCIKRTKQVTIFQLFSSLISRPRLVFVTNVLSFSTWRLDGVVVDGSADRLLLGAWGYCSSVSGLFYSLKNRTYSALLAYWFVGPACRKRPLRQIGFLHFRTEVSVNFIDWLTMDRWIFAKNHYRLSGLSSQKNSCFPLKDL